jgi:hypothetical protein
MASIQIDGPFELRTDPTEWILGPVQPMHVNSMVIRRDVYVATGGSDPQLVRRGDTHLFFKLGLAGPVCAVAGSAGDHTRDDAGSIVMQYPPDHETYIDCTIWLYRDLLRTQRLTRTQRRVLGRRLADAYWQTAKRMMVAAPLKSIVSVIKAMRHDPAILPKRIHSRIGQFDLRIVRGVANGTAD